VIYLNPANHQNVPQQAGAFQLLKDILCRVRVELEAGSAPRMFVVCSFTEFYRVELVNGYITLVPGQPLGGPLVSHACKPDAR
jgi:hypothetical protein